MKTTNNHPPSSVTEYFGYYRPEGATHCRLMAITDGKIYPPITEYPLAIAQYPNVQKGTYQILYCNSAGPIATNEPITIKLDAHNGVLETPGQLGEEEDKRNQRIARGELRGRRLHAHTERIENEAKNSTNLTRTVAETNERHSIALANFTDKILAVTTEREQASLVMLKSIYELVRDQGAMFQAAVTKQIEQSEKTTERLLARGDWAGVAKEVVTQVGTLAVKLTARPTAEPGIHDGIQAKRLEPPSGRALPAGNSEESPPSPSARGNVESSEGASSVHILWLESLGLMDSPSSPTQDTESKSAPMASSPAKPEPESGSLEPAAGLPELRAWSTKTSLVPILMKPSLPKLLEISEIYTPEAHTAAPKWSPWREFMRRVISLGEVGFIETVTNLHRARDWLAELLQALDPPELEPC